MAAGPEIWAYGKEFVLRGNVGPVDRSSCHEGGWKWGATTNRGVLEAFPNWSLVTGSNSKPRPHSFEAGNTADADKGPTALDALLVNRRDCIIAFRRRWCPTLVDVIGASRHCQFCHFFCQFSHDRRHPAALAFVFPVVMPNTHGLKGRPLAEEAPGD